MTSAHAACGSQPASQAGRQAEATPARTASPGREAGSGRRQIDGRFVSLGSIAAALLCSQHLLDQPTQHSTSALCPQPATVGTVGCRLQALPPAMEPAPGSPGSLEQLQGYGSASDSEQEAVAGAAEAQQQAPAPAGGSPPPPLPPPPATLPKGQRAAAPPPAAAASGLAPRSSLPSTQQLSGEGAVSAGEAASQPAAQLGPAATPTPQPASALAALLTRLSRGARSPGGGSDGLLESGGSPRLRPTWRSIQPPARGSGGSGSRAPPAPLSPASAATAAARGGAPPAAEPRKCALCGASDPGSCCDAHWRRSPLGSQDERWYCDPCRCAAGPVHCGGSLGRAGRQAGRHMPLQACARSRLSRPAQCLHM